MKKWTYILAASLLVLWGSCGEPTLPDEVIEQPVFYLAGQLGEGELSLTAGENDYYLHTDYQREPENLYSFRGVFSPTECLECPESLEIIFRDVQVSNEGASVDPSQSLATGAYLFYEEEGADGDFVYRVAFSNESGIGNETFEWDFGDGTIGSGLNPVHDYSDTTLIQTTVCLETVDASGCITEICNDITLEEAPCKADFTHELWPNSTFVAFQNAATGQRPIDYRWDFGDGFGASLGNPGYSFPDTGLFTVCLTITDGAGCRSQICKNVAADPVLCEHNFTYQVEKTSIPDPFQFGRVSVRWRDADGELFSSDLGEQGAEQFFQVLSSQAYQDNRAGDPTQQLAVSFDVLLYGENETLRLSQANGVIAVAYPE
ncbi:MAG: PKD domain-containing protein [Bacteroidota bacterium]